MRVGHKADVRRALLLFALCLACGVTYAATVTVTVDYSVAGPAFVAKGTGHTGQMDGSPDHPVQSLYETSHKPYTWRGDYAQSRYIAASTYFAYTYPCNSYAAFNNGQECNSLSTTTPWTGTDGTNWGLYCKHYAGVLFTAGTHDDVIWDVWNEPNGATIFKVGGVPGGDLIGQRLADVYDICYRALSAEYIAKVGNDNDLVAGGPAFSDGMINLFGFLFKDGGAGAAVIASSSYYAKLSVVHESGFGWLEDLNTDAANVKVDFLSVHLFSDEYAMDWGQWIAILREAIIAEIDGLSLSNLSAQWGADLSNLPIHVTEMFGKTGTYDADPPTNYFLDGINPGHVVVGLAEMHEAGVTSMTRACWYDPEGSDVNGKKGCGQKTLSGLLRPDMVNPTTNPSETRAAWWVYKYYGELEGGLEADVSSTYDRVHGVGANDASTDEYRALIGFTHHDRSGTDPTLSTDYFDTLSVDMDGLGASCVGAVTTIKHISASSYLDAFTEADLMADLTGTVNVNDGTATILIPEWSEADAAYITVDTTECVPSTHMSGGAISGGDLQ